MDNEVWDFYTGYEGEGEIQFIQILDSGNRNIIRIWDGYFDDIMDKIEPEASGWTGLAYCYNLVVGWYDESPWKIPNTIKALQQIKQTEKAEFRFQESKRVTEEICNLLSNAIDNDNVVYIARE
ncbi:hypothetical protein SAMN02745136_04674 [Anaerocolumna jejuensis DSM 15929]|uniref:Uncharacterized protein n=1 Tax=Anaerocolumna jejuensis DSM 15929 TaxID=1121322 RepID=A0A1M6ZUQ7_9FIRM|nr:hypothetical protein [Anaerocolumna jejuensis]SHL34231.1 hypothetical protein SAMN02745136_04674 [Anaerocolumna jejuensis DSM 15929]